MKRLAIAIARERTDLPELGEIGRFASHGLAILHGPVPLDLLEPSLETLQAYASVIARLHVRETILPLRFGSIHDSEAGLDDWLRVRSLDWRAALDEVEGCDEMGLRVLLDRPAHRPVEALTMAPADRTGTAYMRSLKARRDDGDASRIEADRVANRLREALGRTFRRSLVEEPAPGRERLLSMTCLVPRASLGAFIEAIGPLQVQESGKLLLTGPWPPYSFAGRISGSDLLARNQ